MAVAQSQFRRAGDIRFDSVSMQFLCVAEEWLFLQVSSRFGPFTNLIGLLGKIHLPEQLLETRIRAQRIEPRIYFDESNERSTQLNRSLQCLKCFVLFSEAGVD
jgi:hypothetical protein